MKNRCVFKKYATMLMLVGVSTILFLPAACTREQPENEETTYVITMITMDSSIGFSTNRAISNITVDWGDGAESNMSDAVCSNKYCSGFSFGHNYTSMSAHNITVTGDSILLFVVPDKKLSALDVSRYPMLSSLHCNFNQLTNLDVSRNIMLGTLYCDNNQLTNLDVSYNTALGLLSCSGNQLTKLDVSKNIKLFQLGCTDNQLKSLNLSSNTELTGLNCSGNQLTKLDVSNNTKLNDLDCSNNKLTVSALNDLFRTLHNNTAQYPPGYDIYIGGNPGAKGCDVSIAEKKGWTVKLKGGAWFKSLIL